MNFLKILLSGILISGISLSQPSEARRGNDRPGSDDRGRAQTLQLNMNNAVYQGGRSLDLSNALTQAYRHLDLNNARLESVRVFAKSRRGRGTIELSINNRPQDRQVAPEGYFEDNSHNSFYAVDLNAHSDRRGGRWLLNFDGNIKVNRIEARVKMAGHGDNNGGSWPPPSNPPRPPHNPTPSPTPAPYYQWAGTGAAERFTPLISTFILNQWNLRRLNVVADGNDLQIHQTVIEYSNGQQQLLPELSGYVPYGSSREVYLYRTDIARVHITATSPNLIGSRGRYQLYTSVQ